MFKTTLIAVMAFLIGGFIMSGKTYEELLYDFDQYVLTFHPDYEPPNDGEYDIWESFDE